VREISTPRLVALGALGGVLVLLLVWIISAGSSSYRVTAYFENAGQLVPGNQVQIGGLRVGQVESVGLADDGLAKIVLEIDNAYAPLHENTLAVVRVPGLAGIAARYIALTPGPDNLPAIENGGVIGQEDTQGPVEVDAVFAALDPRTLNALQSVIQGSAEAFKDRGRDAMRAIEQLNPALTQSSITLREAVRDQAAVKELLSGTSDIVATLAKRQTELEQGTAATATATGAIARQRAALTDVLTETPGALRQANTTLVNVRTLLRDARPAIAEARPAARGASDLLPELRPLVKRVRSEAPEVRQLVGEDLPGLMNAMPGIADAGGPVLRGLAKALDDLSPVVSELRPYVPDLIAGLGGVGGSSAGYYDSNGSYARVQFVGGERQLTGVLGGLADVFAHSAVRRCPGAAETYAAPDDSSPFLDDGNVSCDPDLGIPQP
jgi:phospholipid/cholesterol/gamma-HCH transport system substrate-binding protein